MDGGTENGLIYVVTHLICATGTVQSDLHYLLCLWALTCTVMPVYKQVQCCMPGYFLV